MDQVKIDRELFENFMEEQKTKKNADLDLALFNLLFPSLTTTNRIEDNKIHDDIFLGRLIKSAECLEELIRDKNKKFEQKCDELIEKIPEILEKIQVIRLESYKVQSEITEAKVKLDAISSLRSNSLVHERQQLQESKLQLESSLCQVKLTNLKQTYKQSLNASLLSEWKRLFRSHAMREPISAFWLNTFYENLFKSWLAYRDQINQKHDLEARQHYDTSNFNFRILENPDICFEVLTESFIDLMSNLEPNLEEILQILLSKFSTSPSNSPSSAGLAVNQADNLNIRSTECLLQIFVEMSEALDKVVSNLVETTWSIPMHGPHRIYSSNFKNFVYSICVNHQYLLSNYVKIESATLLSQLTIQLNQFELTRNLSQSVTQIFSIAHASLDRARNFSHFASCPSIVFTMKDFFNKFLSHLVQSVQEIKRQSTAFQTPSNAINWSLFHRTLVLIVGCGLALEKMQNFESQFQIAIEQTRKKFDTLTLPSSENEMNVELGENQLKSYSTYLQIEFILRPNQRKDFYDLIFAGNSATNIESRSQSGDVDNECSKSSESSESKSKSNLVSGILFDSCHQKLKTINKDFVDILFSLILDHICAYLRDGLRLEKLNRQSRQNEKQDTNSVGFAPQAYITHVGQQLLLINKNIEPYSNDSESLIKAFQLNCSDIKIAQCFVREISMRIVNTVLVIYGELEQKLTNLGKRQLVTDMLYLDNVFNDLQVYRGSQNLTFDSFKKIITS